jgi:hypothetical protein
MLTNSRDIKRCLERGLDTGTGCGITPRLQHPDTRETIVLPHPKKDLGRGLVHAIYKKAKWKPD